MVVRRVDVHVDISAQYFVASELVVFCCVWFVYVCWLYVVFVRLADVCNVSVAFHFLTLCVVWLWSVQLL